MLSLANITDENNIAIDGLSLVPLLADGAIDRKEIFWHYPNYHASGWTPGAAIRQGDWKLIFFYETGNVELYNLADDISEQNNLASKYPERVSALKKRLIELQESMNANKAALNKNYKKR